MSATTAPSVSTKIVRGWDGLPRVGDAYGPLWMRKVAKA